jgi:hypothetical protein
LGQAFVFYGGIVVSLTCTVYHWGTFIEAEIVEDWLVNQGEEPERIIA